MMLKHYLRSFKTDNNFFSMIFILNKDSQCVRNFKIRKFLKEFRDETNVDHRCA